ncbi:MAG: hypothetical protein IJW53_06585 [Clostridia bacterium]|nr:hypothetical protein [Clostridia bacterium]
MENAQNFSYSYSAPKNKEIESIRSKYITKEETKIERLRRLDKQVSTAGQLESLCTGVIGSLIFGTGMCFGLDALAGADWLTLAFAIPGALVMLAAYPIYKRMQRRAKRDIVPEILALTDELSAE